jgi:PAS domain S-box-containing protein
MEYDVFVRRDGAWPELIREGGVNGADLRPIFERLPEAVLIADDRREFVDANDAALALLGIERGELIGQRIDDLAGPAAALALEANWRALLTSGAQEGEMDLHLPRERTLRIAFRGAAHAAPGLHVFVVRRSGDRGHYRAAQRLEEQARLQAARLKSLAEASRGFAEAGVRLGPLLDTVARQISSVFGGGGGVGLRARTGRGLALRKLHHPDPEAHAALRAARFPADAGGALEQVLHTGQSVLVATPGAALPGTDARAAPIQSMMLVPMRAPQRGDRVVGAVWASRERADQPFTPRDLALLEDLAERAVLAIESARALRKARRTTERTLLLQEVMAAIAEPMTAQAVAEVVLQEASKSFGAAAGVIYRADEANHDLLLVAASGSLGRNATAQRLGPDAPFVVVTAVNDRRPVLFSNRAERNRHYGIPPSQCTNEEGGAVAAVPLFLDGRTVGGLALQFIEERVWKDEDVALLTALARHTAQALERARLFERAEEARRDAEQAVNMRDQSLALLDTLLASAPIGLGYLDRELRYRRINNVLAAMNGLDRDAHLGRTVREVLPDLADRLEPVLQSVLDGGRPVIDFEVSGVTAAAPGERRHFRASYYPVRPPGDSTIVGVGAVVIDVTAQRRSVETVALLAEAGSILSSSLDHERALADLTRMMVPRLGDWCVVEIIEHGEARAVALAHGDPQRLELLRELRRRYPPRPSDPNGAFEVARDRRARLIPDIGLDMLAAWAQDADQLQLCRAVGMRSAIVVPLVAAGRGFGALTLVSSESGRRYGPETLAVVEELAHRAALAVENARLYADTQDAVRVREEFLSIAGHELKTPLTALKLQLGGLLRLMQRPAEVDRASTLARLEVTVRQSDRLEKLINQLLDVSRIAAGRLSLDREDMDLGVLAREVASRFADEAARAGSTLAVATEPPLIGRWDRVRMEQVVANLISNAIKYGRSQPIEVRVYAAGDDVGLEVRDHGIGIAPEHQARVFGRFERAVSDRHFGGLGLGLWIVRQVIESHGGVISVDSAPDQGSRFVVVLPRRGTPRTPA